MEPMPKNEALDRLLQDVFGFDRRATIQADRCAPPPVGCGGPVDPDGFRDEASKTEYRISALCQQCQNEVFEKGRNDGE